MRTAKLTQPEFKALAMAGGEVVNEHGDKLYFNKSTGIFRVSLKDGEDEQIMGLWCHFDGINEFIIIKEPNSEVELTWNGGVTPEEVEESLAKALEKPEFPAFEDIEWVMVEAPEWYLATAVMGYITSKEYYHITEGQYAFFKTYYENSKDFKVTFALKEKPAFKVGEWVENGKNVFQWDNICINESHNFQDTKPINRKLHENRALAVAVRKWLLDNEGVKTVEFVELLGVLNLSFPLPFYFGGDIFSDKATLPADLDLTPFIEQYRIELAKEQQRGL